MLDQLLRLRDEAGVEVDSLEPFPHCSLGDLAGYEIFTKRRCVAGITTCTIGTNGDIRPCSHAEVVYGNIQDEGFLQSWKQMQEWRDGSLIPKECWDCHYLIRCGAGCRVVGSYRGGRAGELSQPDLCASNEEGVTVELPTPRRSSLPNDFHQLSLVVSPGSRFRREDFGGVIDNSKSKQTLVNSDTFSLVQTLARREGFTLTDVSDEFGISIEELTSFLGKLWDRGVIISV
ncbi:MAG: SPASM domain-containing protein [Patescibacteria group bacterium]